MGGPLPFVVLVLYTRSGILTAIPQEGITIPDRRMRTFRTSPPGGRRQGPGGCRPSPAASARAVGQAVNGLRARMGLLTGAPQALGGRGGGLSDDFPCSGEAVYPRARESCAQPEGRTHFCGILRNLYVNTICTITGPTSPRGHSSGANLTSNLSWGEKAGGQQEGGGGWQTSSLRGLSLRRQWLLGLAGRILPSLLSSNKLGP